MGNITPIGKNNSEQTKAWMEQLIHLGYVIKKDKGYFEIFFNKVIVGNTKLSPAFISPIRAFSQEFKNPKVFCWYKKFKVDLEVLDIPFMLDRKGTGKEIFLETAKRSFLNSGIDDLVRIAQT